MRSQADMLDGQHGMQCAYELKHLPRALRRFFGCFLVNFWCSPPRPSEGSKQILLQHYTTNSNLPSAVITSSCNQKSH